MWRYNFTKEKTQSKNIVKLKPLELQEEDEAEGPGGAGGGEGEAGWIQASSYNQPINSDSIFHFSCCCILQLDHSSASRINETARFQNKIRSLLALLMKVTFP